tara:strand:- start:1092 stop:1541 length:450 start_codon:yes stop_codon:yes gene_type:complete
MSIKIDLSPSSKKYLRRLKSGSKRTAMYSKILKLMDREGAITAGYISKNYLSGQRLNRITGTLARSVVGAGEQYRGLPAMRIGILSGPALQYAGILEVGSTDKNPESPFSNRTGIYPRRYLRDGADHGVQQLTEKLEDLITGIIAGRGV